MKKLLFIATLAAISFLAPSPSYAQDSEGVESFKQDRGAWRRKESEQGRREVTQRIRDSLQGQALRNITEAEQAFCYNVVPAAPDFDGYTIDGMEITGFCGLLSRPEINLFVDEFLSKDENVSNVVEKCIIQPRIMLRFIKGVDFSDVLFSSPCHSFTVFYAGKIKSFNASPASAEVDAVIGAYEKKRVNFVSPALLEQILPIGVPQNDEQKAIVNEKTAKKPIRNWQKEEPKVSEPEAPKKKGWNRLNFGNRK